MVSQYFLIFLIWQVKFSNGLTSGSVSSSPSSDSELETTLGCRAGTSGGGSWVDDWGCSTPSTVLSFSNMFSRAFKSEISSSFFAVNCWSSKTCSFSSEISLSFSLSSPLSELTGHQALWKTPCFKQATQSHYKSLALSFISTLKKLELVTKSLQIFIEIVKSNIFSHFQNYNFLIKLIASNFLHTKIIQSKISNKTFAWVKQSV